MSEAPKDAKGLFHAALEIQDAAERAAFLDRSCNGDPALRQRVEDLLRAYGQPDGPLDKLAAALAPTVLGQPIREQVGTSIGRYKLMEQIGEGGFGLVFVAEQQRPIRRKVALKIIKPGMDTRDVIGRFEAERQALALMDHPNIARVLDAGTTESGRPYFVMELVRGIPITDFCDRSQLTPQERLRLFVDVCNAVQHAHQKGIIHRDLKPSNVLVTLHDDRPVVKVIDFGVAKALHQSLTDRTVYTRLAQIIGTPLYMSPEQAQMSGLDIDTRSDVYSLGVLLYELLTGSTPFDKQRLARAAFDELLKILREEEPPRPSLRLSQSGDSLPSIAAQRKTEPAKLSKMFSGDLDWIAMKALEKDRTRRYETASGLAADVQRYLNEEPVEAGPPTVRYRLRKLVRKHRTAVVTVTAFALLLLGAVVLSTWLALREKAARNSADKNAAIAQEEANRATAASLIADRERRVAIEAKAESDRHAADAKLQATRADASRGDAVRQRKEAQLQQARAEAALSQSEWRLYGSQIAASQLVWGQGKPDLAVQRLQMSRTDHRGFEYAFLSSLYSRSHKIAHVENADRIIGLAFSTDGNQIAAAGRTVTAIALNVSRWNLFDAAAANNFGNVARIGTTNQIENLIVFNDASNSGAAVLWSPVTDKVTAKVVRIPGILQHAAYFSDGKLLATCDGEQEKGKLPWKWKSGPVVTVLDVGSGRTLHTIKDVFDSSSRKPFSFTLDGSQLAAAGADGNVSVWDLATGRQIEKFKAAGKIDFLAVSSKGKWIATTPGDGAVQIWEVKTGRNAFSLKGEAKWWPNPLIFSPDEQSVAIRTDNGFALWRLANGKEMFRIDLPLIKRLQFVFSPDSKLIATESPDEQHAIRLWDARNVGFDGITERPRGLALCDLRYEGQRPFETCFSPDSRWLASATSADFRLKPPLEWWDVSTKLRDRELEGFSGDRVSGMALGPGSRILVKGCNDGAINLFDMQTGEKKATWKASNDKLTCLAFSRADDLLAAGGKDRSVTLWDAQAKRQIRQLRRRLRPVLDLSFAGQYLEAEYPRGRSLGFNPDTEGKGVESFLGWSFSDTPSRHESFTYNPARKLRAKAEAQGFRDDVKHVLQIWNDHVDVSCSGHADAISSLSFRADGKRIASGSWDRTVRIWNVDDGKQVVQCSGHAGRVYSVAFRPDGKHLISAGEDKTIRFWDPETGRQVRVLDRHAGAINCVAYHPSGRTFVTASDDKSVRLWDDATGNELVRLDGHTGPVHVVAFSPDGTRIASASDDTTVIIWEASSRKKLLTLRGHQDSIRSMLFLPDGKRLVTGSWDATVRIWDLSTGKVVLTKDCVDNAEMLVFSVDGKRLTCVGDSWIQTWDVASGREVLALRRRRTEGLVQRNAQDVGVDQLYAVSSDGEWIFDGESVWATATGRKLSALRGVSSRVHWANFNNDGKYLATVEKNVVTVWNARTGEMRSLLKGHTEQVYGASFNPDATRVATASEDNTVILWDAATGRQLHVLAGHADSVNAVTFSPDGERLASVGDDDVARIWEPNVGVELCAIPIFGFNLPVPGQFRHVPNRCSDVRFSSDGNWLVVGSDSQKRMIRGTFDPEDLNGIGWNIVVEPDARRDDYERALRYAQKADRLAPDDPSILNTLGVAQYRLGEFVNALATLKRSHQLNAESKSEPIASDLAFLAMAHHALKHTTEAQEVFRQMTALFKKGQWKDDDEAKKLYEEAVRRLSTAP